MVVLSTPLREDKLRALRIGDMVLINGIILTGRDRVHRYLFEKRPEMEFLENSIIYHCGPIVKDNKVLSAGPTTSIRLERYTPELIAHYHIKAIIGKGGMGEETLSAMKRHGCVYLQATGGAGAYLAKRIKRIVDVKFLEEFGMPEALWILEVEDFPAVVTMDSHGESLHKRIEEMSRSRRSNS
jgi:tartrate/fumarate subfamily iron-sulfur-dependent hydro-lyase beta chain